MHEWTEVTAWDLIDVVEVALENDGEDKAEILRFLGGVAQMLKRASRHQPENVAREIEEYIRRHADEAGICPTCGRDLEEVEYHEYHPIGRELRRERYCPLCEAGELESARKVAIRRAG